MKNKHYPKENFANISEYDQKNIDHLEPIAAEVNKFWPAKQVFYGYESENKQLIYSRTAIVLEHPFLDIEIDPPRRAGKDKWDMRCYSFDMKNITYHDHKIDAKEPNDFKVLTTKKIQAWVDYFELKFKFLSELNEKRANIVADFLKSIEGQNVQWYGKNQYGENNRGEIVKNGLLFKFEISTGYVSKRIEIHYKAGNDLDTFLKLADNKYQIFN